MSSHEFLFSSILAKILLKIEDFHAFVIQFRVMSRRPVNYFANWDKISHNDNERQSHVIVSAETCHLWRTETSDCASKTNICVSRCIRCICSRCFSSNLVGSGNNIDVLVPIKSVCEYIFLYVKKNRKKEKLCKNIHFLLSFR